MTTYDGNAQETEWRDLLAQLGGQKDPEPQLAASVFADPNARKRVGDLITKAMLGEQAYMLYKLYCGNSSSEL